MKKILYSLLFATLSLASVKADALVAQNNKKAPEVQLPKLSPELTNKPQAVLFKLHDIKPLQNAKGEVTACEYTATFYNRTQYNLRQAKVNFGWTDQISEMFLSDEEKVAQPVVEEKATTKSATKQNKPEEKVLGTILSSVDLPALGSLKQVSVRGTVNTDECFLLFDNVEFSVSDCAVLGQENTDNYHSRSDNKKETFNCGSLFSYINSKHPEYYAGFKEISYEEEQKVEKNNKEKEKEAIDATNAKISEHIQKTNDVISNIQ